MMRGILLCSVVAVVLAVVLAFPETKRSSDSDKLQENHDFFDTILQMIKMFLCKDTEDKGEDKSDDLFQMIIDLAKIFLCPDNK